MQRGATPCAEPSLPLLRGPGPGPGEGGAGSGGGVLGIASGGGVFDRDDGRPLWGPRRTR